MTTKTTTTTTTTAKATATDAATAKATATTGASGKILITGATGFLGAHLVRVLRDRGETAVRTLQSGEPPAWLRELGVEIVRGSVTSSRDVAAALDGVDRVYHLAGLVSQKPADAHRMYHVHVDGTRVLCEAAREAGVRRIVLASTSGTIAVSKRQDAGLDESSPAPMDLIARWPYYASKRYQEEAARRACADRVELVTLNPSLLLGPGDERLSSTRVVLQFLGREISMTPPGGTNLVDVRDVAAVFPVAMERAPAGARYLLGAVNWSFAEFFGRLERMTKVAGPLLGRPRANFIHDAAHMMVKAQAALYRHWGKRPPLEPSGVDMASHYWYFDSDKAARELGFVVRDPTQTLFDTVKYLRENFLGATDVLVRAS